MKNKIVIAEGEGISPINKVVGRIVAHISNKLKLDNLIKAEYFLNNVFAKKIEDSIIAEDEKRQLKALTPVALNYEARLFGDDIADLKLALQRAYLDKLENPRESGKKIGGFAKANAVKKYEKEIENYFSQFLMPEIMDADSVLESFDKYIDANINYSLSHSQDDYIYMNRDKSGDIVNSIPVTRGFTTILYADSGVGKSSIAMIVAERFMSDNREHKVIYFDLEKSAERTQDYQTQLRNRFRDGKGKGQYKYFATNLEFDNSKMMEALEGLRNSNLSNTLIIIDSLGRYGQEYYAVEKNIKGFKLEDNNNAREMMIHIKGYQEAGATVLIIHHAKKGGSDFNGAVPIKSETNTLLKAEKIKEYWRDNQIGMNIICEKGCNSEFSITLYKNNFNPLFGEKVEIAIPNQNNGKSAKKREPFTQDDLLKIIQENDGLNQSRLFELVSDKISDFSFRNLINSLLNANKIKKEKGKLNNSFNIFIVADKRKIDYHQQLENREADKVELYHIPDLTGEAVQKPTEFPLKVAPTKDGKGKRFSFSVPDESNSEVDNEKPF